MVREWFGNRPFMGFLFPFMVHFLPGFEPFQGLATNPVGFRVTY